MGSVVPLDRSERVLDQFFALLHVVRVSADRQLDTGVCLFSPAKVVVGAVLFHVGNLLEKDLGIVVDVVRHADTIPPKRVQASQPQD